MKIVISENQFKKYRKLLESFVDDFEDEPKDDYKSDNDEYDIDKKEGRVFKTEIASMPLKLTYSHKNRISENETEYYCEVIYYGDEFLGVFVIDKRGYLTDVDFPSVVSEVDEDVRLQDVLKDMGREYYFEFEHWLDSEVIPVLMD
jgi:hypothetical protein